MIFALNTIVMELKPMRKDGALYGISQDDVMN